MDRIYHTWDKWECFRAGFFENKPSDMSKQEGEEKYKEFLSKPDLFACALTGVLMDWPMSCEHNLSNEKMNRIAWLGQAAMCYKFGIPAICRGGYNLLTISQQEKADKVALQYLNNWLISQGEDALDAEGSQPKSKTPQY